MAKNNLLDDLLDPATLEKLKKARSTKVDLTDLVPPPPKFEVLAPIGVVLFLQENHCANCGAIQRLPLGMLSLHPLTRNGRRTGTNVSIRALSADEYPHLARERDITRTSSVVCDLCADQATESQDFTLKEKFPQDYQVELSPEAADKLSQAIDPVGVELDELKARVTQLQQRLDTIKNEENFDG
jgi:hypothetical protein